ncbi:ABC transporter substrate-binding protein [Klebsiella pneumoniae subsp. pneumoniae]|nr:ABC transporter substrate-binding protein [Klebsiella pneumoniae subsp. pneumoniae]
MRTQLANLRADQKPPPPACAAAGVRQRRPGPIANCALATSASAAFGILKARQSLETAFASLGVNVLWSEFPAGPQLLHALACNEIDFGTTGEAPPVFAQASNSELMYVAWEPPAPRSVAMVVPQESDIRQLSDLRGKRIALNKGSNVHWLLLQILEDAGLGLNDVRVVYTPPKYPLTASDYLAVDALMMWDPLLSDAEHTGELRVVASGEGRVNNHQFYLSRRDYLALSMAISCAACCDGADPHRAVYRLASRRSGPLTLGRAGDRRPVAEHGPRPPQPSPAADGSVGDPRPADHRRSLYAPRAYRQTGPGAQKRCGTANPRRTSSDR